MTGDPSELSARATADPRQMTGVAAVLVGLLVMFCPWGMALEERFGLGWLSGPAARSSHPRMWSWSVSMAHPASVWASPPGCASGRARSMRS